MEPKLNITYIRTIRFVDGKPRIEIPRALLDELGWQEGDDLTVMALGGRLELFKE